MKALFIDLDGTLLDSLGSLYRLYETFLAQFQLQGTREEFDLLNGLTIEEIVATIEKRRGLTFDVDNLSALYRKGVENRYEENRLFPFAKEVLAFSKAIGLSLYIVTSAKRVLVEKIIEAEGLNPFIDGVITAEGLPRGKPAPDIYLKALQVAHVKGDDVLVIEDALNGIKAAEGAGLTVFRFDPISNDWRRFFDEVKKRVSLPQMEPLTDSFRVVVEPRKEEAFSQQELQLMEERWEAQALRSGSNLINGERLSFISYENNTLRGAFLPYKVSLALPRRSVAVTGITKTRRGDLLIARRSSEVASFPGFFELAPSGGLDPTCQEGELLNIKKQIADELEEEVNIPASFIEKSSQVSLWQDERTVEIVMELTLQERGGAPSWEYTELHWLEKGEFLPFLATHYEQMVPLSRTLLAVCSL